MVSVAAGSLAERAGLRAGDVLSEWRRAASPPWAPLPAGGLLGNPAELDRILGEEAPRGALTLAGVREGEARRWTLPAGTSEAEAGLVAAPSLAEGEEALDREASRTAAAGEMAKAAELWRSASLRAFARGDGEAATWLLARRALALEGAREDERGDRAFEEALAARLGDRPGRARLLGEWGRWLDRRRRWPQAAALHEEAARLLAVPGSELERARALHDLAEVHRHADDYPAAARLHAEALGLREAGAPESLAAAESWLATARVRLEADLGAPLPAIERAASLARRIHPDSLFLSRIVVIRGMIGERSGDPEGAERDYSEALALARRSGGGYEEGRALRLLAAVAGNGGRQTRTEDLLRQALGLFRRLPGDFLNRSNLAGTLVSLAYLRSSQGDPEAAFDLAREAVEVHRDLNPRSLGLADALMALGQAARLLDRFDEARAAFEEAVRLREPLTPGSFDLALAFSMLGHLELDAGGGPARAEPLLRRALQLLETNRPASLSSATTLLVLSEAVARRGDLPEAAGLARRSLALLSDLAPDSLRVAEALWILAGWERELGRREEAERDGCEAAAVLHREGERLRGRISAGFALSSQYWRIVVDCAAARAEGGRAEEGFELLEGERARTLVGLRSKRERHAAAPVDPALVAERERWDEEYGRLAGELAALSAESDAAEVRALQRRLAEHQDRYDDLARRLAPPADPTGESGESRLAAVRRKIEPGSALLAFAVGEKVSLLFVVHPARAKGAVRAFRLPVGRKELDREVAAFRALVEDPAGGEEPLLAAGRALYRRLLEPAEGAAGTAGRWILIPDGPLQALPFAALRRGDGRYLIESKTLRLLPSISFLPEGRRPEARRPGRVAAFADPDSGLAPLPAARREVASLRTLFPRTRVFAGKAATEAQALRLGEPGLDDFELVHFAVHSSIDERFPLRSALMLGASPAEGGREGDGRLEAREIVEDGRFGVRLVTLSSCESALGKRLGGEGLVGLTQAFLIAGARSVLAALWSVPDAPTADFMGVFYDRLRRGEEADTALRQAQLSRLRLPATSRPSYWAAFALFGMGE